jgi:hypothetical protein
MQGVGGWGGRSGLRGGIYEGSMPNNMAPYASKMDVSEIYYGLVYVFSAK